jgi:hypothetical protein
MAAGIKTQGQIVALRAALEANPAADNVWYNFLWGLTESVSSQENAAASFDKCVTLAKGDPALDWALFLEFEQYGQTWWADKIAEQLDRELLAQGNTRVPLIAQQLLAMGVKSEQAGDRSATDRYYRLSAMFDADNIWPALRSIGRSLPADPTMAARQISLAWHIAARSWPVQLTGAGILLLLLRSFGLFFVAAVFTVLAFKYGTRSVHLLAEQFPSNVPPAIRLMLAATLTALAAGLGPFVFFWLLLFLFWQYLSRPERWLAVVCAVMVCLAPVVQTANAMVDACRVPSNPVMLFERSITEGYSADLEQTLKDCIARRQDDYLPRTAAAITLVKKKDAATALGMMRIAYSNRPHDPVVLCATGLVFHRNNIEDRARAAFRECSKTYPGYAAGVFNQGQLQLETQEALDGTELITRATRLDPEGVGLFVEKNDRYYTIEWPALRRFIIGDYSPWYFWKNVFPVYGASVYDASKTWKASFWGIPPVPSFVLMLLLLAALLATNGLTGFAPNRIRRVLECQVCGAAMCRKCSNGLACEKCLTVLNAIREPDRKQAAKARMGNRSRALAGLGAAVLTLLFPGTGMLYEKQPRVFTASAFIALTAMLWATAYAWIKTDFSVAGPLCAGVATPFLCVAGLYLIMGAAYAVLRGRRAIGRGM